MIIKNIKLAKNKMVELGNINIDSDDVIVNIYNKDKRIHGKV